MWLEPSVPWAGCIGEESGDDNMGINAFIEAGTGARDSAEKAVATGGDLFNAELHEVASRQKSRDRAGTKTAEAAKAGSPIEQLTGAMKELQANKFELTPAIKKKFEDAIVASDRPSPKIPELKKQAEKLAADMEKALPKEKQEEVGKLMQGMNSKIEGSQLSDEDKLSMAMMLQLRDAAASDEDIAAIDQELDQLVPGLGQDLSKIDAIMKPLAAIGERAEALMKEMKQEASQDTLTRVTYARVLHELGDDAGARKWVRDAAAKHQELLKDAAFMGFAMQLGLDPKDLRTWQV